MNDLYIPQRIAKTWSREYTLARWAHYEIVAAAMAGAPAEALETLQGQPIPTEIGHAGGSHEMVAFLEQWLADLPQEVTCWVHRDLTTSDVTDSVTSHSIRSSCLVLAEDLESLAGLLLAMIGDDPARLARTHARPAAPTEMGTQVTALMAMLQRCADRLQDVASEVPAMATGPVGEGLFRSGMVTAALDAPDCGPTLQALPRDWWAPAVSALTTTASVLEQVSRWLWMGIRDSELVLSEGPTSSSMPHKVNASRLERVWGMARLTRGLAVAMGESVAMWDERDLGHSSVERVAWPSMFGYVATAIDELVATLETTRVDTAEMSRNLLAAGDGVHSHRRVSARQASGVGYFQARESA